MNAEVERDANHFVALMCLVFGLTVACGALAGRLDPMFILAWRYVAVDLAFCTAPCLAVAAWSFRRGHSGPGIKWAATAAMLSASSAILFTSQSGFIVFIFVILGSCRYFRPKFVWGVFAAAAAVSFLASIPHAAFGYMTITPDERMLAGGASASFGMSRPDYWKSMMLKEWPTCLLIYFVTAFISWRICVGGRDMAARERAIQRRLADVERGLAIAASQYFAVSATAAATAATAAATAAATGGGEVEKLNVEELKGSEGAGAGNFSTFGPFNLSTGQARAARQPDVSGWTMGQISACLAECKRRAAADPAFAELVERDPAAAVRQASETPF